MATEKIIDKLGKLIAMEQSARGIGNMAEAEAFASKVQELLTKHKLDMSDVEFAEEEMNEPPVSEYINTDRDPAFHTNPKRIQPWIGTLLMAVCEANFCESVQIMRRGHTFYIVGRASDRETSKMLFKYLYGACMEMAPRAAKEYMTKFDDLEELVQDFEKKIANRKMKFKSAFKAGFASAILSRMERKRVELKAGAQEQGLIRIDQLEKATADKFKECFPNSTFRTDHHKRDAAGFNAGTAYGETIGIGSQKRLGAGM